MAQYKVVALSLKFLAVDLETQRLPGRFTHTFHHQLNHDFDLSGFDRGRYAPKTPTPPQGRGWCLFSENLHVLAGPQAGAKAEHSECEQAECGGFGHACSVGVADV